LNWDVIVALLLFLYMFSQPSELSIVESSYKTEFAVSKTNNN